MKRITFFIFICAFFLFRPYHLQKSGLCYIGDDHSYFAHACSLAFGEFPSYDKEFYISGGDAPKGSIGSGILAAPFVFSFSFLDRLASSDIIYERTPGNIPHSWSLFGFVFASSFYFWLGCFLLYKGLSCYFKKNVAQAAIILMVLCQGIPLFVFRRPVFSHIYEFFIQASFVFLLLRINAKNRFRFNKYLFSIAIGILSGLIFLVRLNDFLIALLWPIIILSSKRLCPQKGDFWKIIALPYLVFISLVVIFKGIPAIGYYEGIISYTLEVQSFWFYLKRIIHILLGIDWGLIYTAPFILIGLIVLVCKTMPLKKRLLFCLISLVVNFYTIIAFKTQGGWYGYRYFISAAIPVLVFPLAFLLEKLKAKPIAKIGLIIIAIIAIFPLVSMLSFEGNSSNLTLSVIETNGIPEWDNHTYQLQVWKTILFQPKEFFIVVFKGGLLYLIYLLALLFKAVKFLPSIVLEKYPDFQLTVLIKTFTLYLLPFFLYGLSRKLTKKT